MTGGHGKLESQLRFNLEGSGSSADTKNATNATICKQNCQQSVPGIVDLSFPVLVPVLLGALVPGPVATGSCSVSAGPRGLLCRLPFNLQEPLR